jgi:hypothetical protein
MRITTSMDEGTYSKLKELMDGHDRSKSKTIRDAIDFYAKYKGEGIEDKKIDLYMELLSSGEHIILDVDHWIMFLRILEGSMAPGDFWKVHEDIASSHADQFSRNLRNFEEVLKRLEACNLFKLRKASNTEYTLILGSAPSKKFIKILLERVAEGMKSNVKIKEDFSKLRIEL